MRVKELMQALNCFDQEMVVVIRDENLVDCKKPLRNIAIVEFSEQYCIIETEQD